MRSRRIAGAPITWGACEVPGWGHQMTPDRVLGEMAALGLTATELGPDGFLPGDPARLRQVLSNYGLSLVAGFVPAVLHRPESWKTQRSELTRQITTLAACGASMIVLAASTGDEGYDRAVKLRAHEWAHLVDAIAEVEDIAAGHGVRVSLHPHYGTMIEGPQEVGRLLSSSPVGLCLDTGHLVVGGGDPVSLAEEAADRITHVHLKDVDTAVASRVREGELSYRDAVVAGLYRVLGAGDIDIPSILNALDGAGYEGWYVLEQDTVLGEEPGEGQGPMTAAAASYRYLTVGVPAR
jgi:inosose dehydratase